MYIEQRNVRRLWRARLIDKNGSSLKSVVGLKQEKHNDGKGCSTGSFPLFAQLGEDEDEGDKRAAGTRSSRMCTMCPGKRTNAFRGRTKQGRGPTNLDIHRPIQTFFSRLRASSMGRRGRKF